MGIGIVKRNVDAIAVEELNVAGMMRRCKVQICEQTGKFLTNGQSRKRGLNRAIADASWSELILKIEYLAAKQGKVLIKVEPKHSSQECRKCGHKEKLNREKERFICVICGHLEHADIGAAKTIRDRAYNLAKVPGDSRKLEHKTSKRPKKLKETSPRPWGKRGEPGNCGNTDIGTSAPLLCPRIPVSLDRGVSIRIQHPHTKPDEDTVGHSGVRPLTPSFATYIPIISYPASTYST